jgi:hypothetical protein
MFGDLDWMEVLRRMVKYLVEGLIVGVAATIIPKKPLNFEEIVAIGVTAAAVFSLLDVYSPSISAAARTGAGLAMGGGVVGGYPVA